MKKFRFFQFSRLDCYGVITQQYKTKLFDLCFMLIQNNKVKNKMELLRSISRMYRNLSV